ncbi:ATP synthase F1 subunit epsilon [Buchnera aphidicola (Ceratovacuna keduensis)]|uniref:ATP synthase F1 subunit epsilon n=1 Tax=Buchnera aphidicola TaxID=9 RepID=UPI0031B87A5F
MTFFLNVVSKEKKMFSKNVIKIYITGSEGQLCIYSGHSQLLTCIKPGPLYILDEKKIEIFFYLSQGILEIQPKFVTVLSDVAISASETSIKSLLKNKKKYKKIISSNIFYKNET